MRVITNSEALWDILGTCQRIFSSCCLLFPPSQTPPCFFFLFLFLFPPLLFCSALLLIVERPPSSRRGSVRLLESNDYHGAVLDGAVWLDACNCGVIKHWHRGFNGGLSNSLTFSAAQRGERLFIAAGGRQKWLALCAGCELTAERMSELDRAHIWRLTHASQSLQSLQTSGCNVTAEGKISRYLKIKK